MTTTTYSPSLHDAPALPWSRRLASWRSDGASDAPVPHLLRRAIRKGRLDWGTASTPVTPNHVLALFETLRHPLLDQHALTIHLTAEPGSLGTLSEALERADHRHAVEIDLLIEDADEAETAALESESLAARGLFVRWILGPRIGQDVGRDRDQDHVVRHLVEHAVTHGVADVVSRCPTPVPMRDTASEKGTSSREHTHAIGAPTTEIDRQRLAYALPRDRACRG